MSERIDQFCENLRVKLTTIDNNMRALKVQIDRQAQTAEQDALAQLDAVKARGARSRQSVSG